MKIVEVIWDDHAFYEGDWTGKGGLAVQVTVGFIVKETKRVVKVAQSYQEDGKKFAQVLVIDKRMVRSIREVSA